MSLKLARWLCLALPLLLCVRSQRSSWGSPKRGSNGDSGFWSSGGGGNSGLAIWATNSGNNKKSGFGDVYSNSDSGSAGSNSYKPFDGNDGKKAGSWGTGFNSNPTEGFPAFGAGRESGNEKSSGWNSDKLSDSNGNWQSSDINRKQENEKKLASITNWNSNSNRIPSTEENDSIWAPGKGPKPSGSAGGQSSRPGGSSSWNSDINEINNWDSKPAFGSNNGQNSRPSSGNTWSSENNNNNWNSDTNSGSNKQADNNIFSNSGDESNSGWTSSNKKKVKPTSNYNGGKNSGSGNNQSSGSSKWEQQSNSNNSQKGKDKKPSASGTNSGKTPTDSNGQTEKKPSTLDTSILDELDKNDWYFGRESDYPNPPLKSSLNIDVSELWNFDKNRQPNKNLGSSNTNSGSNNNKRRRNRQIDGFEGRQGIQCECVGVDLCDEEDMILTQEDIKFDWRPLAAFRCQDLTEVCCVNPKTGVFGRTNVPEDRGESLRCGQRRVAGDTFGVLGENIAQPGEFPWILSLKNVEVNCSASLIHPALALTAAHCVGSAEPGELIATAGIWKSNEEPSQSRRVVKIIPHPGYDSRNPRNDIALLVLENPFRLTDNVNTICLPVTNDKWDPGECVVAGWNLEEINGEELAVVEKEVVDFLPQEECQNIMLVTDLWRNYVLHDSFVCGLGRKKRGSCLGDEGSPLVCPSKKQPGTYLQIGIVSKGINCDDFGRPGIFTNVLKFLDWINKNTFELGLFYDIDIRSL